MEREGQEPQILPQMQAIHQVNPERQYKTSEKQREYNRKKTRKYRRKHLEQERARCREYYQEHKEQYKANEKKWNKKNREKVREKNRRWQQKNPEKYMELVTRHRIRKAGAPGSHTAEQIEFLRNISGGFCPGHNRVPHYVGPDALTADHTIPLSKGGSDYIENIRMMCRPCNSSKGTK